MNHYLFEYRDENYKPQLLEVEASGKKDAISKAQALMKNGWYLVSTPRRMFTATQGNVYAENIRRSHFSE